MTEADFERTVLPCHRKMFAAANMILGDRDEASDAVQEAFAKLWEKREELEELQIPDAYCLKVVSNLCVNRIRMRTVRRTVSLSETDPADSDRADRQLEHREELERVRILMRRLTQAQQKVIAMASVMEMDTADIAQATGFSVVNVRALLSRGRRRLKQLFDSDN